MDVGGDDVAQLSQSLPVQGGGQLLLLDGQLPADALAEVIDGLADRLALLAHGVGPVPEGVEGVEKLGEALGPLAFAVLEDGAEGEVFRHAVPAPDEIRGGVVQVLREEQVELLRGVGPQIVRPGVQIPGGKNCRLPADQGGKSAQIVHEPVTELVRTGGAEQQVKIRHIHGPGVQLRHRPGGLVVQARKGGTIALVQAHPAQTVENSSVGAEKIDVAGPAHQLADQALLDRVAHLVGAVEGKGRAALHGGLLDSTQPRAAEVLAQEHTEHGRLCGIFGGGGGQVEPGRGGIRRQQQLLPSLLGPQEDDHRVPGGLVDLFHSGPGGLAAQLAQHRGEKICVKCHKAPPSR